jgi:superfamily I DNA/RNA helicase
MDNGNNTDENDETDIKLVDRYYENKLRHILIDNVFDTKELKIAYIKSLYNEKEGIYIKNIERQYVCDSWDSLIALIANYLRFSELDDWNKFKEFINRISISSCTCGFET